MYLPFLQNLGKRKETDGRKFEDYVLGDFCIRSPSEVWTVDEIEVMDCRHRERRWVAFTWFFPNDYFIARLISEDLIAF